MKAKPDNILISRTDSIGDVILTLPLVKILKDEFPGVKIGFLGRPYTKAIIEACEYIDEYIALEDYLHNPVTICGELVQCIIHVLPKKSIARRAKKINIPLRIGTTNRIYHWLTCNKLIRLSRKKSYLHETKLNLKLLKVFGIKSHFSLEEIIDSFGLTKVSALDNTFQNLIDNKKLNVIIHPKSQGSSREWGLTNFSALVNSLDKEKYKIFISGTEKEKKILKPFFDLIDNDISDVTGLMNLSQFTSFISECDSLVANSTGPLHIAAALGKYAYGIFPPLWPMNPLRWGALGKNAKSFVIEKNCNKCRNNLHGCLCMQEVSPILIKLELEKAFDNKFKSCQSR